MRIAFGSRPVALRSVSARRVSIRIGRFGFHSVTRALCLGTARKLNRNLSNVRGQVSRIQFSQSRFSQSESTAKRKLNSGHLTPRILVLFPSRSLAAERRKRVAWGVSPRERIGSANPAPAGRQQSGTTCLCRPFGKRRDGCFPWKIVGFDGSRSRKTSGAPRSRPEFLRIRLLESVTALPFGALEQIIGLPSWGLRPRLFAVVPQGLSNSLVGRVRLDGVRRGFQSSQVSVHRSVDVNRIREPSGNSPNSCESGYESRRSNIGLILLLLLTLLTSVSGCNWHLKPGGILSRRDEGQKAAKLPNAPPARDAIRLEAVFIERPIRDPLLGNALWREVDQVGTMPPDVLASIQSAGFRVGHVGSTPPAALQTLMGYATDIEDHLWSGNTNTKMNTQQFTLRSGSESEIPTHLAPYQHCEVVLDDAADAQPVELGNVRCMLRVHATRLQDGWIRLEFQPEIHHDSHRLRVTATEQSWQNRTRQLIEPMYDMRFSIDLSLGEMVLITSRADLPDSFGHLFFVGPDEDAHLQRMLVVRLTDMRKVDPVYAE